MIKFILNKNFLGSLFILGGLITCSLFICLLIFLPDIPVGLPCQSKVIEGNLKWKDGAAYVVKDGKNLKIAYHAKSDVGPLKQLYQFKENTPIQAETCGRTLVRVLVMKFIELIR